MASQQETSPSKKRVRNPEWTREQLIVTAIDIMARKGVDALTLKDVVLQAGISRSAAYLHFSDRDHLVEEAKLWIKRQLREGLQRFDDQTGLYERVLHTTRLILTYPDAAKMVISDALSGGELNFKDPLFEAVKEKIQTAIDQGAWSDTVDAEISTCIHLGTIFSTILLAERHAQVPVEELANRFARQWCDYLEGKVLTPLTEG